MTRLKTEHLDSEEQRAFRLKARAWMSGKLPPRIADEPYMDWEREDLITADRRIQRVLWEGGLAGITLPGMPPGSPGMDGPKTGTWTIYAVTKDGKPPQVFATV